MPRILISFLRVAIPLAILGWLLFDLMEKDPGALRRLVDRPKQPGWLLLGFTCLLTATCLSFVRWYGLVRGLDIAFTLRQAFRLGFLGCLFNFVGPGAVGGDVAKAYLLVRDQRSRRAEAVATIFLDRVVGLYSLLVVASMAIVFSDFDHLPAVAGTIRLIPWVTLGGGVVLAVLLLPGQWVDRIVARGFHIPLIGPAIRRVVAAWGLYRRRRLLLALVGLVSVTVHVLVALSMHCVDRGFYAETPTLREHLLLIPLATTSGVIPVPGGIGTYEAAMVFLYRHLPKETMEASQGLTLALSYRLMTILIAAIGIPYYFLNRAAVVAATEAAEADSADESGIEPNVVAEPPSSFQP